MNEYIRLDTTIIALDNLINEAATGTMARTLFKAKDTIYNQQRYVINVQPVKHGRWSECYTDSRLYSGICTVCGKGSIRSIKENPLEYCPKCGAKMDLKDGDTK